MVCLPLDYVSGFLFGLNATRVKPELRERVILYQRECYKVLAEAFNEGRLTSEPTFNELSCIWLASKFYLKRRSNRIQHS
jgi:hypothetical protein